MKGRRKTRRNMLKEKKVMHKLEAEQAKWRAECMAHDADVHLANPRNFHRPVNAVDWNMPKRKEEDSMQWPMKLQPRVRRDLAMCKDKIREYYAVDATDTREVISEPISMPKVVAQKRRVRPGGRVEHLMKRLEAERMTEDVANATEFAKAICSMLITPKVIAAQKAGNV